MRIMKDKPDAKATGRALDEVMDKTCGKLEEEGKIFRLSRLAGTTRLIVYADAESQALGIGAEIQTKDELEEDIRHGEVDAEGLLVYLAETNVARFDMRDLEDMIEEERDRQEQYDGWDDDMIADLRQAGVARAFLSWLNERAQAHATYDEGELVIVDWEDESHV